AAVKEVEENAAAAEDGSPITAEEQAQMEELRERLGNQFCRRCNYCAPCTVGISIPNVFLFAGYLNRYDLAGWARSRYDSQAVNRDTCIESGECERRCPYQLPLREMLKKAHEGLISVEL